jgi:hypothetical protein
VVYFKNCDCVKCIKNTPTCFGSRRIHYQGVMKQDLTKITYNCSSLQVMRCQCLAAYLTCTVYVYCTGWRCTVRSTTPNLHNCAGYALSVFGCIFNLYCVCTAPVGDVLCRAQRLTCTVEQLRVYVILVKYCFITP